MLKRKKAELKTPHFLSLNRDIVVWSQEAKVEMYVMQTFSRVGWEESGAETPLAL